MRSTELKVEGQDEGEAGINFLPAPIRALATSALKKMMKKSGINSLILSFSDDTEGTTIETKAGFSTVFFKGRNVLDDYRELVKEAEIKDALLKRAKFFEDYYRQNNNLPTRQQEKNSNHE
jgi:hypothetical protein